MATPRSLPLEAAVTADLILALGPKCPSAQDLANAVNSLWPPSREPDAALPHLLGQCAHESQGFTRFEEDLDYSATRLLQIFPLHFNETSARTAAHKPEAIANKAYGSRMGNSLPGDGYLYRGRGLIQLTGRADYEEFGYAGNPGYLSTPRGAVESAIRYWKSRSLSLYLDDPKQLCRRINGGLEGLDERRRLTALASRLLSRIR